MTVIIAVIRGNCRGNYWTRIPKTGEKVDRYRWVAILAFLPPFDPLPLLILSQENRRGIIAPEIQGRLRSTPPWPLREVAAYRTRFSTSSRRNKYTLWV